MLHSCVDRRELGAGCRAQPTALLSMRYAPMECRWVVGANEQSSQSSGRSKGKAGVVGYSSKSTLLGLAARLAARAIMLPCSPCTPCRLIDETPPSALAGRTFPPALDESAGGLDRSCLVTSSTHSPSASHTPSLHSEPRSHAHSIASLLRRRGPVAAHRLCSNLVTGRSLPLALFLPTRSLRSETG